MCVKARKQINSLPHNRTTNVIVAWSHVPQLKFSQLKEQDSNQPHILFDVSGLLFTPLLITHRFHMPRYAQMISESVLQ